MLNTIRFLLMVSALLVSAPMFANVPNFEKAVYLNAKGETPNEFVHSLFGQIGVPVKVEGDISGVVHGVFEGTARDVFGQLSTAFNVHVYFNRSVAYVYHADDIDERLLTMSNTKAKALMKVVNDMNLTDSRNALYYVDNAGLEVVGNKRFVQKVETLSKNIKIRTSSNASKVQKTKIDAKAESSRLIVQEFKLKYASVIDKSQTISGHEVKIPGVATMLRQFIDRNHLPTSIIVADADVDGAEEFASNSDVSTKPQSSTKRNKNTSSEFQARIMAHPQSNSIWIEDTAERMAIYQSMINAMDQEPRMVEIEATIIDINNSRQQELGINWRALNGDNEFLLGNGLNSDLLLQPGRQVTPAGEGGILSLVMGNRTQFIARMRALENLGAAKFVSKPHVITNSNVEAILGATTEFFVRLEGNEAVSLEEKSFGTVLRVTPRVFEDGVRDGINLMISIEDGQTSGEQVDNIPEIARSVVGTNAMVQQGQSLLIGGLIRESSSDSTSKVPLLGDIPALGKLFQSNTKQVTTTERLFLITPRIIGDNQNQNANVPVLRGKIDDIVSTSDDRRTRAKDQIELKSQRLSDEIEGPSPFKKPVELFKNTVLSNDQKSEEITVTQVDDLLVIPTLSQPTTKPASAINQSQSRWRVRNMAEADSQWHAVKR